MTDTDAPPTAPATPPKSGRGLLLAAIAIGALGGLGAGVFALAPAIASTPPEASVADSASATDSAKADTAALAASGTTPIVLTNVILNPADSRGMRFLLVSVGFDFVPTIPAEQFESQETEIRDRILAVLGTHTVDQLVDHTHRDVLRAQLRQAIDSLVGSGRTRRVFFPQFVIQ